MSRRMSETLMGAVILIVAGVFFVMAYKKSNIIADDVYVISAKFNDVTGISTGSDVRIGGVKVGTVQSLSLDETSYQAKVDFSVRKEIKLSADTSASIVGESLLGGKFISLSPGADENILKQGDEIEFTQSSISLEQLLGKFVFSGGGVDNETSGDDSTSDDVEFSLP